MSLKDKIYEILKDGKPHRSDEIVRRLFRTDNTTKIGLFNLHARIHDLRKDGYNIPPATHDKEYSKLCWYQIVKPKSFDNMVISKPTCRADLSSGKCIIKSIKPTYKQEPLNLRMDNITY